MYTFMYKNTKCIFISTTYVMCKIFSLKNFTKLKSTMDIQSGRFIGKLLLNAIEFSLGGSSFYTSMDKTNTNKYTLKTIQKTQHKQYKTR
jgi:hypothetical protein